MAIPVKLEVFEGPLDLLLHLIDKNKVQAYFKYNKQTKKVEFHEKMHSKNELER